MFKTEVIFLLKNCMNERYRKRKRDDNRLNLIF